MVDEFKNRGFTMAHESYSHGDESEQRTQRSPQPKEWRRPALRKLPIAATVDPGTFNQGVGKRQGRVRYNPAS